MASGEGTIILRSVHLDEKRRYRTLGLDPNGEALHQNSGQRPQLSDRLTQIDSAIGIADDVLRAYIDHFFRSAQAHFQSDPSLVNALNDSRNPLDPPSGQK